LALLQLKIALFTATARCRSRIIYSIVLLLYSILMYCTLTIVLYCTSFKIIKKLLLLTIFSLF